MNDWQPIETAPRNERGQMRGPKVWGAYKSKITGHWHYSTVHWGPDKFKDGSWLDESDRPIVVHYWMPLPAPPEESDE